MANPLRAIAEQKYGAGTTTTKDLVTSNQTAASPTINPVRTAAVAKYGAINGAQSSVSSDGTALQAPPAQSPSAATEPKTAREQVLAKYSATPAATTTPAVAEAPVRTIDQQPEKRPLVSDDSVPGIINNTIAGLPKALLDTLGPGKILDYLKTPEGEEAAYKLSFSDFVKGAIQSVVKVVGTPIADIAGVVTGPKSTELPLGLGTIDNVQKDAQSAVENGENPYLAVFKAAPQAIFDALAVAGIAEKVFSPREVSLATGVKTNELPGSSEVSPGTKSFRLTRPPSTTSQPVPIEALEKLQQQGRVNFTDNPNFDPKNPTYFRTTQTSGGMIKGEIVQLKPSLFDTFVSKFGGDISKVPETGLTVVYEKTTSPEDIKSNLQSQVSSTLKTGQGDAPAPSELLTPPEAQNSSFDSLLPVQSVPASSIPTPDITPNVESALSAPITPDLLERVSAFTPVESSAFSKKIIDKINEEVGTKITDQQGVSLPDNLDLIQRKSFDGRPAQFRNGRIEVFVPNLVEDLKTLSIGGELLAHEGEFSKVYKKLPDESMEDLAVRYTKDVIIHEAGHQKTMTREDGFKAKQLNRAVNEAKLSQNPQAVIKAQQEQQIFMRSLEDKANQYVKDHAQELDQEIFGKKAPVKAPNAMERKALGLPNETKVTRGEKSLLKDKIKNLARGAKEGFRAGSKEIRERLTSENNNLQDNKETASKRSTELQKLKQRILDRYRAEKQKAIVNEAHEKAVDKIRAKENSADEKRRALIDFSKLLPFRERGKFLSAINNTSSDKEFGDVLERMKKAANDSDRANLIAKISKELKGTIVKKSGGFPNPKFAIEAQRTLNRIRALQKVMTYQQAQIEIANKISDWQTQHPDENLPAEVLREIEVLKTVGIKDQTAAELANTLSSIQSIKTTGRTAKEIEKFNRDTEIQQSRDKVYENITGGKKLPSSKLSIKARQPRAGVLQSAKDFLTTQQYGLEEVLDVLSMNDVTSKPYESYLSKEIGRRTNTAFAEQNHGELTTINDVNELLKKSYGIDKKGEILQTLGSLKEQQDLGEFKHNDGTTKILKLSRGEAMQYSMWSKDPALKDTFTETMHWTPEIEQAVQDMLTPGDKAMEKNLLEFYGKYYEGINKVFSKEYGIDLPFNENYSPVHRAIDVSIPENVLLAQEASRYATAKNGSLKERVRNNIDLKPTDALENVVRHITKMEHYKAWSDPMYRMRKIFGDTQIRQAITDFHGSGYMKVMDNFMNDFARDGVTREKVNSSVDKIRGNVARAMLGFNLRVGIKQLTGIMNYGIELPTKDFFGGIADFWKDPLGHAKFLFDNSGVLQERFGDGFERDVKYAIQKGYDKKLARANNLSEVMFLPARNADKLTVYMGSWASYRSGYNQAVAEGKTPEQAERIGIEKAETITNRIQESSRLDTLSQLQRGGSLAKLFTMFQSQQSKYLRVMMNAGRNYKAGRTPAAEAAKRIAWAWILVPFLYNLVADQFIDKKYREGSGGLVTRTLLGPLTYPLIVGQMVQQIYGWTAGERFGYQATPVESFMNDIQNAITKFKSDDAISGTSYMLDTAGKLSGVPSTLVTGPVRAESNKKAKGGSGAVSF